MARFTLVKRPRPVRRRVASNWKLVLSVGDMRFYENKIPRARYPKMAYNLRTGEKSYQNAQGRNQTVYNAYGRKLW